MKRTLLLLAIALASCARRESAPVRVTAPNAPVILISVDTLRADHLPAYGYTKVATPNIDALRKDSVLFTSAWSHVPLTLPSHVSILTGQLPPDNGVRNNIGFPFDAAKHPSIPMLLRKSGYATGAAVSAYVLRGNTGLAKAFDFYDDKIEMRSAEAIGRLQRPGMETEAIAEQWIAPRASQPFFFLLHLFEPHTPYDPPEPFRGRFAPYDGEIAQSDAIVGRFIEFLKQNGVYDRALILFLSDHGEGLGDHGEDEHGIFLYREAIHVPLIVKLPKSQMAGQTVSAPVQLIDVLPTVAGITGVPAPAGLAGRTLLEASTIPPRRIYSESLYPRIHLGWSDLRSLVDDRFHFIDAPRPELYAAADTAERSDVLAANRRVYASMRDALAPFSRELPVIGNIDPEEAKKLAALGYLSSTSASASGPLPDPKDRIADLATMKEAAALESQGQLAAAVAKYEQLVKSSPRLTDAWSTLGRLQQKVGRTADAIETYKRAIQLAPSLAPELSLSLAALYLDRNEPADAARHAELGLQTNPGEAHLLLGRAALARRDLVTAEAEANETMRAQGYWPKGLVLMAQIRTAQGEFAAADSAVQQAIAAAGEDVPELAYFIRGDLLARQARYDEAIVAFNEEIRRYPQDRLAYASLAVVYLVTHRRAQANATMEWMVRENPGPASYELAAKTFEQMRDQADAAAWRKRAARR